MKVDRDQFLKEGFLVLRNVIPPEMLDELRTGYEILVDRQREIWASQRRPEDPPGGHWEASAQPRLMLNSMGKHMNERTACAVEHWVHENTQGVSSELLGVPDAGVTEMMLMCNPVSDQGPANWHRDLHPIDTAPLQAYIDDIVENGPPYVQWNICLYDDEVLWVIPGSHLRINTEQENQQLIDDSHKPLPGGLQTHLKAGDGVVYILPILHWGSNYSTKIRRTIHGGFADVSHYRDLGFTEHISDSARSMFTRWDKRSEKKQNATERALRAAMNRDTSGYEQALEELRPGIGEKGKMLFSVFLSKTTIFIRLLKDPTHEGIAQPLRNSAQDQHTLTFNWGPQFADRFNPEEAEELWECFKKLDAALQRDEEHFFPGFQSGPMHYTFNEMPDWGLQELFSSWG